MPYVPPVIVVPGITATYLRDEYPLPPEVVWSVLQKDYVRVALHPDNTRYEALEPARIQPSHIFEVAYKELIEELRYNLRQRGDRPVPVFPFGYDWRQPLDLTEQQLANFVDEVIERTSLLRHYYDEGYADDPKVNLVGHSMGGLLITGYLERKGKAAHVGKVVTLATPYRGSFEAVIQVATGTANLSTEPPSSREREAARVTPALYHLLPTIPGGLEIEDPNFPQNLFDPGLWQPGVLQTVEEYVRLHAVSKKDRKQQARDLFTALLDAGRLHRSRIDSFKPSKAGLKPEDWLCVVGANSTTRVRMKVKRTPRGPDFDLSSNYRQNLWVEGQTPEERRRTGDGTVPFEAALPTFLPIENVVCVIPNDFGYWEVQDRLFSSVAGFHGILPNMDMLHRLIVRHLTGRPDPRGNTWGRPAPGVDPVAWRPPMTLLHKQ